MNERTLAEIDSAYLAALVDQRSTFAVNMERRETRGKRLRLEVTVYFKAELAEPLEALCGNGGAYSGQFRRQKRTGRVRFRDIEANKMLVAVWPHLKNMTRREQAQECFRFHRTQHGRGNAPLDDEMKSIRLDVRRKLMALAGRAG